MEIQRYKALLARDDPDKPWTNTPREVVLYADHLATIAALTADLKIANGGIRTLDEMMELREKHIDALTAERDRLREELNEARWRLHNSYDAFLRDASKKDNCRNCNYMRPPTISHNPDRISCQYAEGWPHWSTKCKYWEAAPKQPEGGGE